MRALPAIHAPCAIHDRQVNSCDGAPQRAGSNSLARNARNDNIVIAIPTVAEGSPRIEVKLLRSEVRLAPSEVATQ